MRGRQEPQVTMLAFVDLEERVPANHPLRVIKAFMGQRPTQRKAATGGRSRNQT